MWGYSTGEHGSCSHARLETVAGVSQPTTARRSRPGQSSSAFSLQPCSLQPSAFSLQPSAFSLQPSPLLRNHTPPLLSNHTQPLLSNHTSPLLSNHTSPLLSNHTWPLLSNHTWPFTLACPEVELDARPPGCEVAIGDLDLHAYTCIYMHLHVYMHPTVQGRACMETSRECTRICISRECTCICIPPCRRRRESAHAYAHVYMRMHTCISKTEHAYMRMHISKTAQHADAYAHMHMRTCASAHAHTHVHMHTCAYAQRAPVRMHIRMHAYACACTRACACTHAHVRVHACTRAPRHHLTIHTSHLTLPPFTRAHACTPPRASRRHQVRRARRSYLRSWGLGGGVNGEV